MYSCLAVRPANLAISIVLYLVLILVVTSPVVGFAATPEQQQQWQSLGFSESEVAWLEQNPRLMLGIDRSFQPYEWLDDEGHYRGLAADFLSLLSQKLGVTFVPVSDKNSWGEVLTAARSGEFDLMSCLVKTAERESFLNFTEPYITSSAVIITEHSHGYISNLEQLQGKTVVIHKGHFTDELLRRDHPNIKVVNTDNLAQALEMVSSGGAEAFVGDVIAASHKIRQLGIVNLNYSAQTGYQSEFRFGVNPEHGELLSILQKGINSISEKERNQIFERWRTFRIPKGIPNEILIRYGVLAAMILMVFVYWNYRLRRSERGYRQSEERFRGLVETTDGIVWEADVATLQFTYISENAERLLGYTPAQWQGKDFWQDHIHPDDRDWALQYCADETCQLRDHDFEYRFIDAWGQTVWLKDMVSVVVEEGKPRWLRGLMLDITEQKQAQQLVQQSEYRFRELIDCLPTVAVQGYDQNRRVIYWNDASVALYGFSKEEAIGKKLEELIIPQEMIPELIKVHRDWLDHGRQIPPGEILLRHKSGRSVPVFSSHVMLQSADTQHEMYCIDISLEEQHRANAELKQMAHFDPLTQLPNRLTFADRLDQGMKTVRRDGSQLALLLMDLDHFKEINDTLGHDYGDLLLLEAAKRLKHCVRETDTVARLGGDEFLIILTSINDLQAIERIARNILQQMAEGFSLKEHRAFVSASIGITLFPDDADSMEVLLKNADQAMYAAKQDGRNRFHYFTSEMEQNAQQRRRIFNDLREAVANHQLRLHYQPIVDLTSGDVKKAEALIRWQHPERLIMPDEFIPVAEEAGLISEIGNWVFQEAARQSER